MLGVSGAGKTTTFRCISGEEESTSGMVTVKGHNIADKNSFDLARRFIGYCPQFDIIFKGLTVREHLEFYATVKGIKKEMREKLVQE